MKRTTEKIATTFNDPDYVKLGTDKSGWETLYQNKRTRDFWLKSYRKSDLHGGGEPFLKMLSGEEALLLVAQWILKKG